MDGLFASLHNPTVIVEQLLYHTAAVTIFAQEGENIHRNAMAFCDNDSTPCKNACFAVVDSPVAPYISQATTR
jgi:hypothetical protein